MHIVIIIQARMGSARLPGKVMMPLAGQPLLLRMVERVRATRIPNTVVVATTTESEDTDIRILCARSGIQCYSGDTYDLLDRHYRAALQYDADVVVKIPSDCPLIDPNVIEKVLAFYIGNRREYDFVSNMHPASWPDGNDVEVISLEMLREAWGEAKRPLEREHTTPYFWDQPERYRIGNVSWESGLDYSMTHRWTIDYPDDYRFIRMVYNMLYKKERPIFRINDILALLDENPWIGDINRSLTGINWYRHHHGELRTIGLEHFRNSSNEAHDHVHP